MFLFNDDTGGQIRTKKLIVNGVEKYRMVMSGDKDKLVYGKGKVHFDVNLINITYGGVTRIIDYEGSLENGAY
jgi:hypothetical protein